LDAKGYNVETNRLLLKLNRFSAWILLIFMVIFLISGYAWTQRIIMPLAQARWMHTQLDLFLVFFFLVHVLLSIRTAIMRWRVARGVLLDISLLAVGTISFWLIASIR
jgi:hypothetical protein